MKKIVYIEGIGYCEEIVINRVNEDGINEPYTIYKIVKKRFGSRK